jgi:hypothetical protein
MNFKSVVMPILMQVMENCMPPPPAATCIAFKILDNNIISIGMDGFTFFLVVPSIFVVSLMLLLEC